MPRTFKAASVMIVILIIFLPSIAFTSDSGTSFKSKISEWWSRPMFSPNTISGAIYTKPQYAREWQNNNPGKTLPYLYRPYGSQGTVTGAIKSYVDKPFRSPGTLSAVVLGLNQQHAQQWRNQNPGSPLPYLYKPWFDVGTLSGVIYTKPEHARQYKVDTGRNPAYLWRPYFSSDDGLSVVSPGRNFGPTITGFLTNDILHRNADTSEIARLNKGMEDLPMRERWGYIVKNQEAYREAGAVSISLRKHPKVNEIQIDTEAFAGDFPQDAEYYSGNVWDASQKPDAVGPQEKIMEARKRYNSSFEARPLEERYISPDTDIKVTNYESGEYSFPHLSGETISSAIDRVQKKHDSGVAPIRNAEQFGDRVVLETKSKLYKEDRKGYPSGSPEMQAAIGRAVYGEDLPIPGNVPSLKGVDIEPGAKFGNAVVTERGKVTKLWMGYVDPKPAAEIVQATPKAVTPVVEQVSRPISSEQPSREFLSDKAYLNTGANDVNRETFKQAIDQIDKEYTSKDISDASTYKDILSDKVKSLSTNAFAGSTAIYDSNGKLSALSLHTND